MHLGAVQEDIAEFEHLNEQTSLFFGSSRLTGERSLDLEKEIVRG